MPVNTRHRTALIWPGATRHGFTMENVALNHEKCRYCLFSSGNQERKRNNIKERTIRRREIAVGFWLFLGRSRSINGFPTQRLPSFKLKLSASSSAGRYEERAAKLAKPHSLSGLPCSSHGTPSSPPIFASASHPRKKANIGSYPLSQALA